MLWGTNHPEGLIKVTGGEMRFEDEHMGRANPKTGSRTAGSGAGRQKVEMVYHHQSQERRV